jgi:hypothetical protein
MSYSDVIGYGTTFRFDGLAVFLLLGSLAILVRRPAAPPAVMAAAALMGVAVMVTIKSLFYFPTMLLVVTIGEDGDGWQKRLVWALRFISATAIAVTSLYLLHTAALSEAPMADSVAMIRRVAPTGIMVLDPFPQPGYLLRGVIVNPWTWTLIGAGVVGLLVRRRNGWSNRQVLLPLSLLLPLGSLIIYRNVFPYYYVFLMPVAAMVAAIPFDDLFRSGEKRAAVAAAMMTAFVLFGFGKHYRDHLWDETRAQRQLVEVVHRMFPEPVTYVDPNSMIASFPKVGFFMSTWGLEHYHRAGQPIFEDLLLEHQPRFLLANPPLVIGGSSGNEDTGPLLPADMRVLRDNFVNHWRTIYVPGKHARIPEGGSVRTRVLISGTYSVEAEAPIMIDGTRYEPGDTLMVDAGWIRLEALHGPTSVTLRAGRDLYRPSAIPVAEPIFRGFYPCGTFLSDCARRTAEG